MAKFVTQLFNRFKLKGHQHDSKATIKSNRKKSTVDVCFIVEGAYPYIAGGVASWVHQLVTNMPEIRFGLITLMADENSPTVDKYNVPENVVVRKDVYLFSNQLIGAGDELKEPSQALIQTIKDIHQVDMASKCPFFQQFEQLSRQENMTTARFFHSKEAWRLMKYFYETKHRRVSFLDYFWTWRAIHGPMLRLLDADYPKAKVYHAVSTGYAGFVGAVLKQRTGAKFILTEHGLYTREREIEIAGAEWIYREPIEGSPHVPHEPFFKSWWRKQYQLLGTLTYDIADSIVTLHGVNKRLQIQAGADPKKLVIVPNGIHPEDFSPSKVDREWQTRPFRVGMIGRCVPIKDVKTFVRAIAIASREISMSVHILGPTDEDPAYYQECLSLADALGIGHLIKFEGKVNLKSWLSQLDLNVMTSVSESQPLVILEAGAAGIPTIATDVGACREMIEGGDGDDLGVCGIVTPVASPEVTARAIVTIAKDPALFAEMADVVYKRMDKYYRQEAVFDFYRQSYKV
jgi:polysaccharide biosynthesis protein PelF